MADVLKRYHRWLDQSGLSGALHQELREIKEDQKAIEDRFWKDLSFGTGGLRGMIGAGDNRMNIYTVGKATQGLANYLLGGHEHPGIAIAYDTRNFSKTFAQHAAKVLCANGIRVYLYEDVRPTPMLSFALREVKAQGGIVITASHNPKEYNGYKVYGPDGCQITDEAAKEILNYIEQVELFTGVKKMPLDKARENGLLYDLGAQMDENYYQKVIDLALRPQLIKEKAGRLHILYTPLHGTGAKPISHVLQKQGYQLSVVKEQMTPDGNFSTLKSPNPEEPSAFTLALKEAQGLQPHVIFATDPDCDRIGVQARDGKGSYSPLTGNQIGALLCNYILVALKEKKALPPNGGVVKTIVTSDLSKAICKAFGVRLFETLTGFKYIGEIIGQWEENHKHSFLLGFEESYGYLAGTFVRDKDGVIAASLIAEMALFYQEQNLTLIQALEVLFKQYGYSKEKLISITLPGAQGQKQIGEIMAKLRREGQNLLEGLGLKTIEDYGFSTATDCVTGQTTALILPESDVLKFIFDEGNWLTFRPSGTEPKMKIYAAVLEQSQKEADEKINLYEALAQRLVQI